MRWTAASVKTGIESGRGASASASTRSSSAVADRPSPLVTARAIAVALGLALAIPWSTVAAPVASDPSVEAAVVGAA